MIALLFEIAVTTIFVAFLIHGLKHYKTRRLLSAIVFVGTIMWLQEHFAMNLLAPGLYHYEGFALWLLDVPLAIPLVWIMVSYISFLVALRTRRFSVGALAGFCFDLLLEPLAFLGGLWIWRVDDLTVISYFGAPLGNACGWLLWCFIGAKLFNKMLKINKNIA